MVLLSFLTVIWNLRIYNPEKESFKASRKIETLKFLKYQIINPESAKQEINLKEAFSG